MIKVQKCGPAGCQIDTLRGSCVNVGKIKDRYVFVSSGHHFKGYDGWKIVDAKIYIEQVEGTQAKYVRHFFDPDISVFTTTGRLRRDGQCWPILKTMPKGGGLAVGFPATRRQAGYEKRIVELTGGTTAKYKGARIAPGDSGGAVFFGRELAGVITGYVVGSPYEVSMVPPQQIRWALEKTFGELPTCEGNPQSAVQPKPKQEPDTKVVEYNDTELREQIAALQRRLAKVEGGFTYEVELPSGKKQRKQVRPGSKLSLRQPTKRE